MRRYLLKQQRLIKVTDKQYLSMLSWKVKKNLKVTFLMIICRINDGVTNENHVDGYGFNFGSDYIIPHSSFNYTDDLHNVTER